MTDPRALAVRHDAEGHRFTWGSGAELAVCDYQLLTHDDGQVMAIVHTGVPASLQGRGLAARLVQAAFDHARAQGWRVRPVCSYVHTFLARHPHQQDLLERP